MKQIWIVAFLLLLSACASKPPLPEQMPTLTLPMQLHIEKQQAGQQQDWLLVIQREGDSLRWSMLDPLGIPQARQLLRQRQWSADGLLPPNPQARELFAAVLFALTPADELQHNYPGARQQGNQRQLNERWRVTYLQPLAFTLKLQQGLRYQVSPLPSETTP
ncbi:DUF3261 domain-containing protein [Pseudomonas akapageensis]|uniref:DUF3261 domain-containing protein n=1 Tax=Pseudomonas akapageensis TaxID=2609961 RepID=UPI001409EE27|nr:DUF3261 domain-containing protein [Pseudomonas akapageensis]